VEAEQTQYQRRSFFFIASSGQQYTMSPFCRTTPMFQQPNIAADPDQKL
jgi:hypothetical protein